MTRHVDVEDKVTCQDKVMCQYKVVESADDIFPHVVTMLTWLAGVAWRGMLPWQIR